VAQVVRPLREVFIVSAGRRRAIGHHGRNVIDWRVDHDHVVDEERDRETNSGQHTHDSQITDENESSFDEISFKKVEEK
jgi:hypothetical protein